MSINTLHKGDDYDDDDDDDDNNNNNNNIFGSVEELSTCLHVFLQMVTHFGDACHYRTIISNTEEQIGRLGVC